MNISNTASPQSKISADIKLSKKKSLLKDLKKDWQLYVIFALPLLYILIFKYYPMYGAIIAFKNYDPLLGI